MIDDLLGAAASYVNTLRAHPKWLCVFFAIVPVLAMLGAAARAWWLSLASAGPGSSDFEALVKKAAETSAANIERRQEPEAIIKVLEENKIKLAHFAKDAEDSAKSLLVADRPHRVVLQPPGVGE